MNQIKLELAARNKLNSIIDRLSLLEYTVSAVLADDLNSEISSGFSEILQGVIDDLRGLAGESLEMLADQEGGRE